MSMKVEKIILSPKTLCPSPQSRKKTELDLLASFCIASKKGKNLGVQTAQDLYDIRMASMANQFNSKVNGGLKVNTMTANNDFVNKVREYAREDGSEVFVICAQIEQEIAELDDEEKKMFLEDLGLSESGLDKLIAASYKLLGLISYLTAGETETRAWTITKGTKAPQAAGKIHSDFERGFIRAEIVSYENLVEHGSYNAAKEKGLVRSEGKEYVVADGDVVLFRFNV